jgi:hypothetical protein
MIRDPKTAAGGLKDLTRNAPAPSILIVRTLFIILTNLVTLNGVVRLGWNAVPLVLMFILESFVILGTDGVKRLVERGNRQAWKVFGFHGVFILFYGFFAALVVLKTLGEVFAVWAARIMGGKPARCIKNRAENDMDEYP